MSKINVEKAQVQQVDEADLVKNFEFSVVMMRRLLHIMGLWPYVSYPKNLRILLIFVVSAVLTIFTIPIALNVLMIVRDFKSMLQLIGPLSFALMNVFKYVIVLIREGQLRECVEWMEADWLSVRSQRENDLMFENAKSAKTFSRVCVSCMYFSGFSYSGCFSFMMDPIVVNNKTTRVFAVQSYFIFFDPYDHFPEVYTLQAVGGFIQFTITSAVACIGIACVMHVCGQIAVTSWMLHNVSAGTFDAVAFGRIIEKHLRAITFAKKLEGYLNSMCLIELMGCCLNICLLGYYFITEKTQGLVGPYTYCMLLSSFTFNIYIFCYIGDQLTEKCGNISNAVYNVDWYDLSGKDAKNLLMIMVSTKRTVVLTAGKMATLSMPLFSSVLKASFSYLNMLRTVTIS